jgi:ribosomal protein S18 acetylase RimI-like enzyme
MREGDVTVAPAAGRSDLDAAAEILDEAAHWLASRGLPGWAPEGFRTPQTVERRALVAAFEAGELYLGWQNGSAVATVSLLSEDRLYWPQAPPDASYVHRLAVRRNAVGRGIGRAVLDWAEKEALNRGRTCLRLDCVASDAAIRAYYERAGFRHRGDVVVRGVDMSLYERTSDLVVQGPPARVPASLRPKPCDRSPAAS